MRYLGPADALHLEEGGRAYKVGDDVPIDAAAAKKLGEPINGGHAFKGVVAAPRDATSDIAQAKAKAEAKA